MFKQMTKSIKRIAAAASQTIVARTWADFRKAGPGFMRIARSGRGKGYQRHPGESTTDMMYRLQGLTRPVQQQKA